MMCETPRKRSMLTRSKIPIRFTRRRAPPTRFLNWRTSITYDKTASVLRMLESYLGEETFRAGVNNYLRKHAYGNAAAADFWNSLAHVSKKPVDKIMSSFVEQPGPPFVSVKTQCQGSSGSDMDWRSSATSMIGQSSKPATINSGKSRSACRACRHSASPKCELLTRKQQSLSLAACSPWVDANAGAHGYYRSGYDAEGIQSLAKNAESSLSSADRIMLLSDVWASVRRRSRIKLEIISWLPKACSPTARHRC